MDSRKQMTLAPYRSYMAALIFDVIEFTDDIISDIANGVVDLVDSILDWFFGDSCEEESAEAC